MDNYLYPAAMALLSPDFGYAGTAPAVRTLLGGRPLPESTGCRTELGKDGTLVIDYRDGHLVLTERPHFFRVVMFASSCMTHLDKGTNAGGAWDNTQGASAGTPSGTISSSGGSEARPVNVAMMYCIRVL